MPAHQNVNPQQLKMFMTPKEITTQYHPLEGDTGEVEDPGGQWGVRPETHAEVWQRKSAEAQLSPRDYHEMQHGESYHTPQFDIENVYERSSYPAQPSTETTSAWGEYEHREGQYLERKLESHQRRSDVAMGGQSIWGSVRQSGVQSPVHLGTQFGKGGKPEVVGGHHRIAAAMDTRPNQLIPVLHHEDIYAAKPMDPGLRTYWQGQVRKNQEPSRRPSGMSTQVHEGYAANRATARGEASEMLRKGAVAERFHKAYGYT